MTEKEELFCDCMNDWAALWGRKINERIIDMYWKELEHFSFETIMACKRAAARRFETFPRIANLLPFMAELEMKYGPSRWIAYEPDSERLTGFGEWSERDLVREALGWRALREMLNNAQFTDMGAVDRTVKQARRYKADLEAGLKIMGIVPTGETDPIAHVEAHWEYKAGIEIAGREGSSKPEQAKAEELPF